MSDTKKILEKEVKGLCDYLNKIATGNVYRCCDEERFKTARCPHCGQIMELYDMRDYLYSEDIYDTEYTIDNNGEYKSTKMWTALGGPTVWLDTATSIGAAKGAWGSDEAFSALSAEAIEAIDRVAANMYSELKQCA